MSDSIPGHVETTVKKLAEMHGDHVRRASRLQRVSEAATSFMGRPSVAIAMFVLVAGWIIVNLVAPSLGLQQPDPPPFNYLELVVSALALAMTILILVSQRRADVAAVHRSQLTLQLAAVSEQKIAKVIELLEEQRRENPALPEPKRPPGRRDVSGLRPEAGAGADYRHTRRSRTGKRRWSAARIRQPARMKALLVSLVSRAAPHSAARSATSIASPPGSRSPASPFVPRPGRQAPGRAPPATAFRAGAGSALLRLGDSYQEFPSRPLPAANHGELVCAPAPGQPPAQSCVVLGCISCANL